MTVFNTAYDTLACNGFQMKKTIDAIKTGIYSGAGARFFNPEVMAIEGGSAFTDAIPNFIHPIDMRLIDEKLAGGNVVIDIRQFGRYDPTQGKLVVRNETDYNVTMARAKLNGIWLTDNQQMTLKNLSPLLQATYASWLSEAIARRYDLDSRQQLDLAILSTYFYASLFSNAKDLDDADKNRMVPFISKATKASADDVYKILDAIPVMESVKDFAASCIDVTGSTRLHGFNAGILFSIVNRTWGGPNADEMIAVALEHPPTWIAIMLAACTERGFKRAQITSIVERSYNKEASRAFVLSAKHLLDLKHLGLGA